MPFPFRYLLFSGVLTLLLAVEAVAAVAHLNTDELLVQADLVVLGEVVSVDQGLDATRAQIRVLQVLKGPKEGPEGPGDLVTVTSQGGKVYIEESEPHFTTFQANLLYLQKAPNGGYICVNRGDGQKIIRGHNIYPFNDNMVYSVPLKDYLKGLESAVKALRTTGQAETPAR